MEFGIFVQGHVPLTRLAADPDFEHTSLMNDVEIAKAADKAGFKYVWASEHHFLDEYSHLASNDVFLGYLAAATERIHLGSGIFNPLPQANHPVKVAEKVATLDHLSGGRFEFGTGRGAGSREILGLGLPDTAVTKEIWAEVVREIPKMWMQDSYSYDGKWFSMPERNVLPKPWKKPHPAMWYAAGNPPSYEMAARMGLGVLGFSVGSPADAETAVAAYKKAVPAAEPIGAYVNDNVMVTSSAVCLADGRRARRAAATMGMGRLQSLVFRYHDTFPRPDWVPAWPAVLPEPTVEEVEWRLRNGYLICGDPDEVLGQIKRYEATGIDQLVFGLPIDLSLADTLETIELIGRHVIPRLDKDPVHRTTRFRSAAAASGR
jgi:alkanesulfonate monooxygenase SsuD/methylene tetrahydromethanopterin reductase-like flavin-dependent oxidoreductase (luciferase family)